MDYKNIEIRKDSTKVWQCFQTPIFIPHDANDIDHEAFSNLLININQSDIVLKETKSDKHTVRLLNEFREKLINFYKKKLNLTELIFHFEQNNTLRFLIGHSLPKYSVNIREISLTLIANFLVLYPETTAFFIQSKYMQIINEVLQDYSREENRVLLAPVYKGIGNAIKNLQNEEFKTDLFNYFFNNINFDSFIQATTVVDQSQYYNINFSIFWLFKQSNIPSSIDKKTFLFSDEIIIQLLNVLYESIRLTISEDTCSDESHLYALSAIDFFLRSDRYSEKFRREALIESKIDQCINRYFDVEGIIPEKSLVLSITSIFYWMNIEDRYNLIEQFFPLLEFIVNDQNMKHRSKFIRRICDSISLILRTDDRFDALEYFYSFEILNRFHYLLDSTKKYEEKIIIIGVMSDFAQLNYEKLPLNDFFFTEDCIDDFLQLLDSEDKFDKLQAIKALYIIFDVSQIDWHTRRIFDIFENNNGTESLQKIMDEGDDEILSYAYNIMSIIEYFFAIK